MVDSGPRHPKVTMQCQDIVLHCPKEKVHSNLGCSSESSRSVTKPTKLQLSSAQYWRFNSAGHNTDIIDRVSVLEIYSKMKQGKLRAGTKTSVEINGVYLFT